MGGPGQFSAFHVCIPTWGRTVFRAGQRVGEPPFLLVFLLFPGPFRLGQGLTERRTPC